MKKDKKSEIKTVINKSGIEIVKEDREEVTKIESKTASIVSVTEEVKVNVNRQRKRRRRRDMARKDKPRKRKMN